MTLSLLEVPHVGETQAQRWWQIRTVCPSTAPGAEQSPRASSGKGRTEQSRDGICTRWAKAATCPGEDLWLPCDEGLPNPPLKHTPAVTQGPYLACLLSSVTLTFPSTRLRYNLERESRGVRWAPAQGWLSPPCPHPCPVHGDSGEGAHGMFSSGRCQEVCVLLASRPEGGRGVAEGRATPSVGTQRVLARGSRAGEGGGGARGGWGWLRPRRPGAARRLQPRAGRQQGRALWCYSCWGLVLHIEGFCHPKKDPKVPSRGGGEGSGPGDSFQGQQPPPSPLPPPGAPLAGRGSATGGPWHPQTPAVPNPSGKGTVKHLLPVLLWQIGLHLEEDVLPLFDEALGLLDGLLLLGTRVGLASGEERQALAAGKPRSQPSTGWCDARL